MLNEEHIKKKEIEFVVGISEMWLSRYFFMFSSFRSEFFKMYHRPIFNCFCLLLVGLHAALPEGTFKVGIILAAFVLLTGYVMFSRPYRCPFSNILLFTFCCLFTLNLFILLLKRSGLRSALFVDNYFYGLLTLVNGFGWFLILVFILFMVIIRKRWPLDLDVVCDAIKGQELAIIYIKRARKLRKRIVKEKKYEDA